VILYKHVRFKNSAKIKKIRIHHTLWFFYQKPPAIRAFKREVKDCVQKKRLLSTSFRIKLPEKEQHFFKKKTKIMEISWLPHHLIEQTIQENGEQNSIHRIAGFKQLYCL